MNITAWLWIIGGTALITIGALLATYGWDLHSSASSAEGVKRSWPDIWAVVSIVLTIAGIAASVIIYRLTSRIEIRNRELTLIQSSPQVLYEWNSNFASLRVSSGRSSEVAASKLFGNFIIRNQHTQTLNSINLTGVFGFDPQILTTPYSKEVIGKRVFEKRYDELAPGEAFSVPVIEELRQQNFDLRILFMEDEALWNEAAERARRSPRNLGDDAQVVLNLDTEKPLPFMLPTYRFISANPEIVIPRVLYGRIIVRYASGAFAYTNVITGCIGFGTPRVSTATFTVFSYFNKQGYSRIDSGGKLFDAVLLPQIVRNVDKDLNAAVGKGRNLVGISATGQYGTIFTTGLLFEINSQGRPHSTFKDPFR